MQQPLLRGCVLLLCVLAVSCASGEKKVPTPEALTAEKAFTAALSIRDAFIEEDTRKLKTLCADPLFDALSSSRQKFGAVSMEFTMRWVDIDLDGTVHLYVSWKRSATIERKEEVASGMGVFLMRGDPLRATEILREDPFQ